ncbi:MAG: hydrogen peroxide-inducible genes activator [Parvularculaceae bacterium]|nr:hydrogen peroxide-inducible genes activator [Parvularculaceae bacterium]
MIPLPTLRQLQFFLALVRRQSFSKAAADSFVSQSTLSSAIKELEGLLGRQLVDRSTRHFSLTPAGKDVAERAAKILALAEDLARSVSTRKPLEGPFQLGVIPTIAPFLLPKAATGLARRFPKLELYLREDLTAALVERLADGSLDAALLAFPYDLPGLDWVEIGEDQFVFAAPAGSPLAEKKAIKPTDLKDARLLLLEDGHCLREHALDACKLRHDDVAGAFGATSLFTLTQMVRQGLGATLLPKMAVDAGLAADAGIAIAPLAAPAPARRIGLAWRKGSGRREDCALLADFFREVLKAPAATVRGRRAL